MFRTLIRRWLPNPLDRQLKQGTTRVFLGWNRGLGDIALGLFAIVHRIRQKLPLAPITFVTRQNLLDGFSMLDGVQALAVPGLERGAPLNVREALMCLGIPLHPQDLIIDAPSPTDWCEWQRGVLTPRLRWNPAHDSLWQKFGLEDGFTYIGVQVSAETHYGLWRNWPSSRWQELFELLGQKGHVRPLLFGLERAPLFSHPSVIDLRGKTTLFEILSLIRHRCSAVVFPDSGLLSMTYYLDVAFRLRVVSLWGDPKHGVLKQNVASPNPDLIHLPLVGAHKDLSTVTAKDVAEALFPREPLTPLRACAHAGVAPLPRNVALVLLAGGQGARLAFAGPKGCFPVLRKTLFQHHVERALPGAPIAVMTSPLNHDETVRHFSTLGASVSFFTQPTETLLDAHYREAGRGPNGNGSVYAALAASGLFAEWEARGIETVVILPVENPLAHRSHAALVAFHQAQKNDVTLQCVERRAGERMGLLVTHQGRISVAEYFDLAHEPTLAPTFSYMGQLACSLPFLRRAAELDLPSHWVSRASLWKREKLLFDALPAANQVGALCFQRETCYAPLKGPEDIAAAEEALR